MTDTAAMGESAEAHVRSVATRSGSSFLWGMRLLPRPRRAAMYAIYAFCREVDDIADEVADPGVAAVKLGWWRKEVASAFAGQPSHPAMRALMPPADSAAAMPMSSEKTTPPKPMSRRRISRIQRGE